MKLISSVLIASFYGLTVRLLYGAFGEFMGVMCISFLFILPILIGYLTIILIPYKEGQSAGGAFMKTLLTCLVIFAITLICNIEGMICWVMAFPPIAILAGIGGIIAFNRKKRRAQKKLEWDFEKEDWEKPGSLKTSLFFLIPLLTGLIEGDRLSSIQQLDVEDHVELQASPAQVWSALTGKRQIDMKRQGATLSTMIGFPHHLNTVVNGSIAGGSIVATYEKGLTFIETIGKIEPMRSLVLEIENDPSKISKSVMDEHIVIGGKHVKLLQDEYKLEELPNGRTRLSLTSHFCINTSFNWYAGLWARLLMSDVLSEELSSIQQSCKK
jgi:hypothetical protein